MWLWRRLLGCSQTQHQGSGMHRWQSGSPVYCSIPRVGWSECGKPPNGSSRPSHYHLIDGSGVPQWSENKKGKWKARTISKASLPMADADLRWDYSFWNAIWSHCSSEAKTDNLDPLQRRTVLLLEADHLFQRSHRALSQTATMRKGTHERKMGNAFLSQLCAQAV
jgi:hypothetical protein